jgi:hypothetical protein
MQQRVEHEFDADANQAFHQLSEGLYRFSIITGVLGLALVGLGIAALRTAGYASEFSGPAIIVLGLVAMLGGMLFLRPRVSFTNITRTRGSDVTKLMDAFRFLNSAHDVFRLLLAAFVVARIVSFVLIRLS